MIQLIPMTEADYADFMSVSMSCFAQDQVTAGEWQAEDAQQNIEKLREKVLPNGLATPGQTFFTTQDAETVVGGLWYTFEEQNGERQLFVMDIEIYPEYRRHGYASQAFLAMEAQARELGIGTIAFHVFKHNHPARAMYKKLGYLGEEAMMWKKLGSG